MQKLIVTLGQLPKWYGIVIILLNSALLGEYISIIAHLIPNEYFTTFYNAFIRINYFITFFASIVLWLIMSFLFHITALLFEGNSSFKRFLHISSYLYVIQTIVIMISIFIVDNVKILNIENFYNELFNNSSIQLAKYLINSSFIICYLITAILIHYIHQIKYLYATLSVVIPIGSIWAITQLFTRIL